jgi:hypothetical protein
MNLKEMEEGVDWIRLAQNRVQVAGIQHSDPIEYWEFLEYLSGFSLLKKFSPLRT